MKLVRIQVISTNRLVRLLEEEVEASGGIRPLSRQSGVSPSTICRILKNERKPPNKLLNYLGYEYKTVIARKK